MASTSGKKKPNPIAAFFGFGLGKPASAPSRGKQATPSPQTTAKPLHSRATAEPVEQEPTAPVAAHSFSGHFITFTIVLVIIALSIYNPLTSFIRQQNEINDAKASIAALQAEQDSLNAQVSWWQDDNYVKQQAKSRLFYVQPGETPYLVVGLDPTSEMADDTSASAKTAPEDSWTTKLWGSLQLAAEDTSARSPVDKTPSAESAGPSASPSAEPTATATTGASSQ